jgi:hypothetical protein
VQAILNATVGDGHKHGVHSLMLIGQHLFSGDRAGTLKVRHLQDGLLTDWPLALLHSLLGIVGCAYSKRQRLTSGWCLSVRQQSFRFRHMEACVGWQVKFDQCCLC